MIEFRMPTLGADMEAGTLVSWLKQPGDAVARGDVVAVVDTEKGAIEIETFHEGVIDRLLVQPGQKTPVGAVLALIRGSEEAPGAAAPESATVPAVPAPPPTVPPGLPAAPAPSASRARVSPAARRAAEQLHVDLEAVEGHGPGGAVTVADVERAASAAPADARPEARPAGMRGAIGAAMARSKREIPHLYLGTTIDVARALAWMTAANERRSVTDRLLPIVLFLKAAARACADVPALNGYWTERGFSAGPGVHVGCAIALRGGGLVALALHDVNDKPIGVVARELADLVARARAGGLRSSEMSDATITVTNLGDLGAESTYAVIYPPQVAIVGVGRIVERPWVVEGRVEPRPVATVTVSVDHRATDGREAGRFLAAIDGALRAPEAL